MKQIQGQKSVVAWFKLADLIERGEKERALGVLRLLTHSFDDQALARQLEADVLRTFNDELAFERYKDAITLYQASDRFQQAFMLLEMIDAFHKTSYQDILQMISLANSLALNFKLLLLYKKITTYPEAATDHDQLVSLAQHSMVLLNADEQRLLQALLIIKN